MFAGANARSWCRWLEIEDVDAKIGVEFSAMVKRAPAPGRPRKAKPGTSPYLRSFVVARINPLRWIRGESPPLEEVLKTMRERAARFNVEKIKPQDLAGAVGPPDEET
jgi:hypothetical protein